MIESPEDALRRQSSIGSLRRKASRSVSTALPKFGFEDDQGGKEEESLGGQLGVSGATLGLENLVGPPKLRLSEVAVIYAVELSVDEVKACWETFGKALKDTGVLIGSSLFAADRSRLRYSRPYVTSTPRLGLIDRPAATRSLLAPPSTISGTFLPLHHFLCSFPIPTTSVLGPFTKRS